LETYAAEGGNITIICNPEAAPRPKFVWKKDGNVIGEECFSQHQYTFHKVMNLSCLLLLP
jgi:hypothetical protein